MLQLVEFRRYAWFDVLVFSCLTGWFVGYMYALPSSLGASGSRAELASYNTTSTRPDVLLLDVGLTVLSTSLLPVGSNNLLRPASDDSNGERNQLQLLAALLLVSMSSIGRTVLKAMLVIASHCYCLELWIRTDIGWYYFLRVHKTIACNCDLFSVGQMRGAQPSRLHHIIQLQSVHCGKSSIAFSLWFELNFCTELEFTRHNLEIA